MAPRGTPMISMSLICRDLTRRGVSEAARIWAAFASAWAFKTAALVDELLQLLVELRELQVLLGGQAGAQGGDGGIVRIDGPDADLIYDDGVRVEPVIQLLEGVRGGGLFAVASHVLGGGRQPEGVHDGLPETRAKLGLFKAGVVGELIAILGVEGDDPFRDGQGPRQCDT